MKLRVLSSLVSIVSLAVLVPACGDDDSGGGGETEADGGASSDESKGESSDTSGSASTSEGDTTGSDSTSTGENSMSVDGGTEEPVTEGDGGMMTTEVSPDGGASTGDTSGEQTTEPPDPECPEVDDRELVEVPAEITEDTTWTCDKVYQLPTEVTVVADGATLTIEPGVEIWGQSGSALVITRGSKIDANGQANAPIVFTSGALIGQRAAGQWGGVLLLGGAPINDAAGINNAEGVSSTAGYSEYGGEDEDFDCGSMSYVRIEFGGFELSPDNELNNLGVAGCGTETELHHIQVHKGSDDGIEFWGGSPTVHHIVSSSNSDDSFDWTSGFSSNVQFLVIQQNPGDADAAFEADGNEDNFAAEPPSAPTFYNVTAIGGEGETGDSFGAVLRRGTAGKFYNSIFMGFGSPAIDVRDAESVAFTEGNNPMLTVENSLFYMNGTDGETHFPADDTNDEDFDEVAFFTEEDKSNVVDEDPELGDPANLTDPDFVPAADSPAAEGGATPPAGWDTSATYIGAFEPGAEPWTAGWTAFPEN